MYNNIKHSQRTRRLYFVASTDKNHTCSCSRRSSSSRALRRLAVLRSCSSRRRSEFSRAARRINVSRA